MHRLEEKLQDLAAEFVRSVLIHGMWEDYSVDDMFRAVAGEYQEYVQAYLRGDLHGKHGMTAELVQLACVALKKCILLEAKRRSPGGSCQIDRSGYSPDMPPV